VRLQGEFVTNASHELRSPLANLRNALEVPLAHAADADWPVIVADALADTTRLQRLTDDLLLLAATGRQSPQPGETTDLSDLVAEQIGERHYLGGAGPTFAARITEGALVPGNELQVGRIVRNLLDNAAKHAAGNVTATVTIEGEEKERTVLLTVSDDGPGVPAADRERVFDRFVRLDDARTRTTGGSGLGLTIARGLAEDLGGTIVADDEGFHARLPHTPT
jgi:signal transduction histidine kinase